jgi:hypothetical protein
MKMIKRVMSVNSNLTIYFLLINFITLILLIQI